MTLLIRSFGAVCSVLAFQACSKVVDFASTDPLGDGLRGKVWHEAEFLEVNPFNPSLDSRNRSGLGFDLAVTGDGQATFVASFYDGFTGNYDGYARLYRDGDGWSAPGLGFSKVAMSGSELLYPSVVGGPGGLVFAHFSAILTPASLGVFHNGFWQPQQTSAEAEFLDFSLGYRLESHRYATAFDGLGRAYTAFQNTGDGNVYVHRWSMAAGTEASYQITNTGDEFPGMRLVYDGQRYVCVMSQRSNGGSRFRCIDTVTDSLSGLRSFTPTSVGEIGFGMATDGEGTIKIAFKAASGATPQVRLRTSTGAAAPASEETLSSGGETSGFTVAANGQTSPEIVYLGEGRYLVAWFATSASGPMVFHNVYDPFTGWSGPRKLWSSTPFGSTDKILAIRLFTNGDGNAGIAVSYSPSAPSLAIPLVYPATAPFVVRTALARYQVQNGWQEAQSVGYQCLVHPSADRSEEFCTLPVGGAILASGTSVFAFPDQDDALNYRFSAVEFK